MPWLRPCWLRAANTRTDHPRLRSHATSLLRLPRARPPRRLTHAQLAPDLADLAQLRASTHTPRAFPRANRIAPRGFCTQLCARPAPSRAHKSDRAHVARLRTRSPTPLPVDILAVCRLIGPIH